MDYMGWELERQRAALAALLLGGSGAEEDGSVRDGRGGNDSGEGPAAGLRPAGEAGRNSSGEAGRRDFERGGPGAWEAVRRAGRARSRRPKGPEAAVSAWEGVLDAETAVDALERRAWGGDSGGPEGDAAPGGTAGPPDGGTGVWRERGSLPGAAADLEEEAYGGPAGRGTRRETAAERSPRGRRAFDGRRSPGAGGGDGGGAASARMPGGAEAAGSGTAVRRMEEAGGVRRGGGAWEAPGGRTVFREAADGAGAGPWGGGWGSAAMGAADGAKALSRAVQRDARRYDGGFTIY